MLQNLVNFFVRPIAAPEVQELYRTCVMQARQPVFYADHHIPDTVEGRFDLLVLHVFLVIQRLHGHVKQTQQLFDILFADMDKNLREMGVSDISIAKKMKPMLAAFYGRAKAYEEALTASDEILAETLRRNLYGKHEASAADVDYMTSYVRRIHATLSSQDTAALLNGSLSF